MPLDQLSPTAINNLLKKKNDDHIQLLLWYINVCPVASQLLNSSSQYFTIICTKIEASVRIHPKGPLVYPLTIFYTFLNWANVNVQDFLEKLVLAKQRRYRIKIMDVTLNNPCWV